MKTILNQVADYVDEMLEKMPVAYGEIYAQPERPVVTRGKGETSSKTDLVTGSGPGHLPISAGYVGQGVLDAAAVGNVLLNG